MVKMLVPWFGQTPYTDATNVLSLYVTDTHIYAAMTQSLSYNMQIETQLKFSKTETYLIVPLLSK